MSVDAGYVLTVSICRWVRCGNSCCVLTLLCPCGCQQVAKMEDEVEPTLDEGVRDMLEYKDDGYIELVLKVLARICDGQHVGLQVKQRRRQERQQ